MLKRRIVGTAGHIDHGKTSLVRALTGVDTDRLPEEKRRGITIDLGFAHLEEEGLQIGFIDVPGHERFVRNMLAGVGGIDAALLVVAADESVMPQTREHLAICDLLHIPTGVIAITKADAVEPEMTEIVRLEVLDLVRGTFLDGKPVVITSGETGAGLPELRSALRTILLDEVTDRDSTRRVFRLPIDRAFTMKGFGAVITGTTIGGALRAGADVEIVPGSIRARARNLQVHGEPRDTITAGERSSVNLADVSLEALKRGQQIIAPGTLRESSVITAELELLPDSRDLEDQTRVRVHHFSAELLASVRLISATAKALRAGEKGWVQLRLESPIVAAAGDRFVIRRYSPPLTIGGGRIVDPHLGKLRRNTRKEILEAVASTDFATRASFLARLAGPAGITSRELAIRSAVTEAAMTEEIGRTNIPGTISLADGSGVRLIHLDVIGEIRTVAMQILEAFFKSNRTVLGMPKSEFLQRTGLARLDPVVASFFLEDLVKEQIARGEGDLVHVPGRSRSLGGAEGDLARILEERFREAGLMPPPISELIKSIEQRPKTIEGVVGYLAKSGTLVRLAENVYIHRDVLESAKSRLGPHKGKVVDVAWFKEFYEITRKIVIPLLEHFDRAGLTKRIGDQRQIQ